MRIRPQFSSRIYKPPEPGSAHFLTHDNKVHTFSVIKIESSWVDLHTMKLRIVSDITHCNGWWKLTSTLDVRMKNRTVICYFTHYKSLFWHLENYGAYGTAGFESGLQDLMSFTWIHFLSTTVSTNKLCVCVCGRGHKMVHKHKLQ